VHFAGDARPLLDDRQRLQLPRHQRVLDGDHRLVAQVPQAVEISLAELLRLGADHPQHAHRLLLEDQRRDGPRLDARPQHRAVPALAGSQQTRLAGAGAVEDHPRPDQVAPNRLHASAIRPGKRLDDERFAGLVPQGQRRPIGLEQRPRPLDNQGQHLVQILERGDLAADLDQRLDPGLGHVARLALGVERLGLGALALAAQPGELLVALGTEDAHGADHHHHHDQRHDHPPHLDRQAGRVVDRLVIQPRRQDIRRFGHDQPGHDRVQGERHARAQQ